jgi:hypothetical protein
MFHNPPLCINEGMCKALGGLSRHFMGKKKTPKKKNKNVYQGAMSNGLMVIQAKEIHKAH